jgi:dienelactone hydrolase
MPARTAYVAFPAPPSTLIVAGRLTIPAEPDGAAVVICHGSDGVDGRGEFHAAALTAQGVATLEIDMWAARGVTRGAAARPRSPVETLDDAFGALAFLARQPEVEAERIGVLGFSWGGVVSLLAAMRRHQARAEGARFAAHVAHYPVCWAYGRVPGLSLDDPGPAPILLQTGSADSYDPPGAGAALAGALRAAGAQVEAVEYDAATHGFDRPLPAQTIIDPFAHAGAGGPVRMEFHEEAARRSRERLVAFFADALARRP